MIKFSNTHSFMHRYRYVQDTTMLGGRQKRCVIEPTMNFRNLLNFLLQSRMFYRILLVPEYIFLLIFVQDFACNHADIMLKYIYPESMLWRDIVYISLLNFYNLHGYIFMIQITIKLSMIIIMIIVVIMINQFRAKGLVGPDSQ